MSLPDKIALVLVYKHDPEDTKIFTETVDAVKEGEYYRLVHVPAFAPNIAYGDLVNVENDEGEFYFDELIEESGFSVVHLVIWKLESRDILISSLTDLGCGVNTQVADNYLVVSIPPETLYLPIQNFLYKQDSSGTIDFKESCLSQVHSERSLKKG